MLDFPDVATALLAANEGDRVYLPGTKIYQSPPGGWRITKSLEIYGDGPGHPGIRTGTTIVPAGVDQDVFVIDAQLQTIAAVYLHDFKITENNNSQDGSNGIRTIIAAGRSLGAIRLERLNVLNMKRNAYLLEGIGPADGFIGSVTIANCGGVVSGEWGLILRNVRFARIVRSSFNGNGKLSVVGGAKCESSGVGVYASALENNRANAVVLSFTMCSMARVDACAFEGFQGSSQAPACEFDNSGGAAAIGACYMHIPYQEPTAHTAKGIRVTGLGNGPVAILPNRFTRVQPSMVEVDQLAADCVIMPQCDDVGGGVPGDIAIASSPNNGLLGVPHARRIGGVNALRGMIVPSGPNDPTTSPKDGMLFFNTSDSTLRVRVPGSWKKVDFV